MQSIKSNFIFILFLTLITQNIKIYCLMDKVILQNLFCTSLLSSITKQLSPLIKEFINNKIVTNRAIIYGKSALDKLFIVKNIVEENKFKLISPNSNIFNLSSELCLEEIKSCFSSALTESQGNNRVIIFINEIDKLFASNISLSAELEVLLKNVSDNKNILVILGAKSKEVFNSDFLSFFNVNHCEILSMDLSIRSKFIDFYLKDLASFKINDVYVFNVDKIQEFKNFILKETEGFNITQLNIIIEDFKKNIIENPGSDFQLIINNSVTIVRNNLIEVEGPFIQVLDIIETKLENHPYIVSTIREIKDIGNEELKKKLVQDTVRAGYIWGLFKIQKVFVSCVTKAKDLIVSSVTQGKDLAVNGATKGKDLAVSGVTKSKDATFSLVKRISSKIDIVPKCKTLEVSDMNVQQNNGVSKETNKRQLQMAYHLLR